MLKTIPSPLPCPAPPPPPQTALANLIAAGKAANKALLVTGCVPQGDRKAPELQGLSLLGVAQIDRCVWGRQGAEPPSKVEGHHVGKGCGWKAGGGGSPAARMQSQPDSNSTMYGLASSSSSSSSSSSTSTVLPQLTDGACMCLRCAVCCVLLSLCVSAGLLRLLRPHCVVSRWCCWAGTDCQHWTCQR